MSSLSLSPPHWRAGIYVNLAFTMERTTLAARRCCVCMATSKFPSLSSAVESLQQVEAAAAAASTAAFLPFHLLPLDDSVFLFFFPGLNLPLALFLVSFVDRDSGSSCCV